MKDALNTFFYALFVLTKVASAILISFNGLPEQIQVEYMLPSGRICFSLPLKRSDDVLAIGFATQPNISSLVNIHNQKQNGFFIFIISHARA